ncbi:hypothetical protein SAMN02949497_0618 [Methylomagnum ishizawai]|uniref:DUF4189 domain-containing protein n=1 Tax=Methylomagnum ishizawai TaxID=1760988 RepID=A0A1Y6CT10_9GAMM|nr:hypothetical protein [Methylomagnum ishizawai]SMF93340.1 hypothetical protein SAMN02949497_0618 [Methylomagnum ishizawai]
MSPSLSRAVLAIAVLAATGSALAKPDEVSEAQVRGCQYLSTVAGSSGYGKHFGWQPIAKADAEKRAGAIGATHIVWSDIRQVGAFNGEAKAKAYACR